MIVAKLPDGSVNPGVVVFYIFAALAVGAAIGAVNGLIVTLLYVPPLVTTIGVNAILFGLTYSVSTGASVQSPPKIVGFFFELSVRADNGVGPPAGGGRDGFRFDFTTDRRRFIAVSVTPRRLTRSECR